MANTDIITSHELRLQLEAILRRQRALRLEDELLAEQAQRLTLALAASQRHADHDNR